MWRAGNEQQVMLIDVASLSGKVIVWMLVDAFTVLKAWLAVLRRTLFVCAAEPHATAHERAVVATREAGRSTVDVRQIVVELIL